MLKRRQILLISFLILIVRIGYGQENLSQAIDPEKEFHNAVYSLVIKDLKSGKYFQDYNGHLDLIPASMVKILTAASGFEELGKDFRFTTHIHGQQEIINGTNRNLIRISSDGDPTLGSPKFGREGDIDSLVKLLQFAGIKKGDIIQVIDPPRNKPPAPSDWKYGDMGNYYASGIFNFNYSDNLFKVSFKQSRNTGDPAKIQNTIPSNLHFDLINSVVNGPEGSGDNAYIHGAPYATKLFVSGSIPPGNGNFTIKGGDPQPSKTFINSLSTGLDIEGVELELLDSEPGSETENQRNAGGWNRTLLSPDLLTINKLMLEKSDNLLAEALFWKVRQRSGSSIKSFGFTIKDGSGLSRTNRINALGMVEFLGSLNETIKNDLIQCLPVGGKSGTLKSRFASSELKGKIVAKTGSMSGVRCLGGYVLGKEGPAYAFCYMINSDSNQDARKLQKRMDNYLESLDLIP